MEFKILIVEDEFLVAEHIAELCEQHNFGTCQTAYNAGQALLSINEFIPDLVLLDINLSDDVNGLEIAELIEKNKIPYLFITSYSDQQTLGLVKKLNPMAYIVKPFNKAQLVSTLEISINKIANSSYLDLNEILTTKGIHLTNREMDILNCLIKGQSIKAIPGSLQLSINTVKYYIKNIYTKLEIHSLSELFAMLK